jgi:hypothetical protein
MSDLDTACELVLSLLANRHPFGLPADGGAMAAVAEAV